MSKYHKLIFGCSAIATATLGSFVQSANATEQFTNKNVQMDRGAILIANGVNGGTNAGGFNPGGGTNPGGFNPGPGGGTNAGGVTPGPGGGTNAGGFNNSGGSGTSFNNSGGSGSTNGGGHSSSTIATAQGIQGRFAAAMSKYEIAAANLAAAEAGQNNASSNTSPVRYGREPGDIAACGCPNADMPTAGTPSKELVAAKAAEAEAAAELAAAKAEARKFLESVNSNSGSGSTTFQPVW